MVQSNFKVVNDCIEGCNWCLYVTVVTCAETMTYTICIQQLLVPE